MCTSKPGVLLLAIALFSGLANAQGEAPTFVQVDHILVETQEAAKGALSMLAAGVPFHTLAFRWSEDPGSAKLGGQLPVALCDFYVPEFASFECSAELRKAGVVKTVFGWHVVVVKGRSTDRSQVTAPDPAIQAPAFAATVSLACGFPGVAGVLSIQIDEPNVMGRWGNRKALVQKSDVEFRLLRTNGDSLAIDRTTGAATVYQQGSEPLAGMTCRPSSQRLF